MLTTNSPLLSRSGGYLGKGKFQRRDFRLDALTLSSTFSAEGSLFAHLGKHEIFTPTPHLTLVAGGKYTTYRSMAKEIVDVCLRSFSFDERMSLKVADTTQPLNPAATVAKLERLRFQAESLAEELAVSQTVVEYLIKRRGEEAVTVLNLMKQMKSGQEVERLWQAEAQFCIHHEMCLNLVDFYCRRSPLFLFHRDNGRSLAPLIAPLFAPTSPEGQIELLQKKIALELKALL